MAGKSDRRSRRSSREGKANEVPQSKKSVEPEAQRLINPVSTSTAGEANAEADAVSSSPLLVRPDGTHDRGKDEERPKHKKRKKSRPLPSTESSRPSGDRPQHRETDAATPTLNAEHEQTRGMTEERRTHERRSAHSTMVISSIWNALSSCVCWGGTLRALTAATGLPQLSTEAQSILRTLDPTTKKSHVEVMVRYTDNMPFASSTTSSYGHPIVLLHLLDICTGLPIEASFSTKPAVFSATKLNAFEWNMSHRWPSLPLTDFLSPRVLVLFEVVVARRRKPQRLVSLQHLGTNPNGAKTTGATNESPSRVKLKPLAWSFFRPVSDHGNIRLQSIALTDKGSSQPSLRLQLFAWQPLSWVDTHHARSKLQWDPKSSGGVPTVFVQYHKRARMRLPCSLHVDIYPIASAQTPRRQVTDDSGRVFEEEYPNSSQTSPADLVVNESHKNALPTEIAASAAMDAMLKCKRVFGEPCLIPQRVLHRLPTGKKGCSCLAFSLDGLFLAAAVHNLTATAETWLIQIYQVNTGTLWQSCSGHQSMVYSLEWGFLGMNGAKTVVSASSDGSAMVWPLRLGPPNEGTVSALTFPSQVFQHIPSPAFVYCALFHPIQTQVVVTGASDGTVRLWEVRLDPDTTNKSARSYVSSPLHLWKIGGGEKSVAIHSIRIESKREGRLFCGDATGAITVWSPASTTNGEWKFDLTKTVRTGQRCIASLALHPRKQHLLVLTHPHALLQYETRSFLPLHKSYSGIECDQLLTKVAFSPDGQFVVSGSEDGVPHLFAAVKGQRLEDSSKGVWGHRFFHGYPLMEVAWNPSSHVVAMGAYGKNHPIVVLCAHREDRLPEDVVGLGPQSQALNKAASGKIQSHDKQPNMAYSPGFPRGTGVNAKTPEPLAADPLASDRAQRTLARRKQRARATLARELEAASSSPAVN